MMVRRDTRDRGSMPVAILVMIVGLGLAALMTPLVLTQFSATTFQTTRGSALHAGQSGIEIALGEIRSAVTDGDGDQEKLPCGPLEGEVGDGNGRYRVTIDYFYFDDPSEHDAAWREDNVMICVPGYGPYDPVADSGTPNFALLTATGTDSSDRRSRTLEATYIVKTTNRNIAGGALPLFPMPGSATHYCMDAGDPLAAGNAVGVSACPTGGAHVPDRQKWAYTTDLTLVLTASVGDTTLNPDGTGLCLDTPTASHYAGAPLVVQPCQTVASGRHEGRAVWHQTWSINSNGHLEGSRTDFSGLDGWCLEAAAQPTAQLTLQRGCSGSTTDPHQAWNPWPSVGAGQAGETNGQLVNFLLFGRCVDVTNQSTAGGANGGTFLILYPCKQNPNPAALDWNQKWEPVAVGSSGLVQWRTYPRNNTSDPYCLTSPQSPGGYVYVSSCSRAHRSAARHRWTLPTDIDDEGMQLPYTKKYLVQDATGLCLDRGPDGDEYGGNLKVVVATCDGSMGQKWNADPNIADSSVVRLHEPSVADG